MLVSAVTGEVSVATAAVSAADMAGDMDLDLDTRLEGRKEVSARVLLDSTRAAEDSLLEAPTGTLKLTTTNKAIAQALDFQSLTATSTAQGSVKAPQASTRGLPDTRDPSALKVSALSVVVVLATKRPGT